MAGKLPPKDTKELDRIRDLFQKGLTEAAKDPEKYWYLQREKETLVEPWEKALKEWDKKKATSDDYAALEAFKQAVAARRKG